MTTQSITILEVIEIRDDHYEKVCSQRHFGLVDAICDAWRQHKEFVNSRNGELFDKVNDTLNYDDVEFGQVLGKRGIAVVKSTDKSVCRIYSITKMYAGIDIGIEE